MNQTRRSLWNISGLFCSATCFYHYYIRINIFRCNTDSLTIFISQQRLCLKENVFVFFWVCWSCQNSRLRTAATRNITSLICGQYINLQPPVPGRLHLEMSFHHATGWTSHSACMRISAGSCSVRTSCSQPSLQCFGSSAWRLDI